MYKLIALSPALLVLTACLNQTPKPDMGHSVGQMVESQIHNHDAVNNPPKGIVGGLDGGMGEKIINGYRQSGEKTNAVNENIEFGKGGK